MTNLLEHSIIQCVLLQRLTPEGEIDAIALFRPVFGWEQTKQYLTHFGEATPERVWGNLYRSIDDKQSALYTGRETALEQFWILQYSEAVRKFDESLERAKAT